LAFASTASVADSEMADTRADILVVGMLLWCHPRLCNHQSVSPAAERPPAGAARRTSQRDGRRPREIPIWFDLGVRSAYTLGVVTVGQ
jgi:hypothetical protein